MDLKRNVSVGEAFWHCLLKQFRMSSQGAVKDPAIIQSPCCSIQTSENQQSVAWQGNHSWEIPCARTGRIYWKVDCFPFPVILQEVQNHNPLQLSFQGSVTKQGCSVTKQGCSGLTMLAANSQSWALILRLVLSDTRSILYNKKFCTVAALYRIQDP